MVMARAQSRLRRSDGRKRPRGALGAGGPKPKAGRPTVGKKSLLRPQLSTETVIEPCYEPVARQDALSEKEVIMTRQFFVVRLDEDGDYVDDWEGVADSFDTLDDAKEFIRQNAGSHPGVKYVACQALTIGESPIPEVTFTDVAPVAPQPGTPA